MKNKLLFLSTFLFLISCSNSVTDSEDPEFPRELTKSEKAIVKADRSFSIDLFKELARNSDSENIFISPLSISTALGMTLNGAQGETFTEMQSTLKLDEMVLSEINEGYKSLSDLLTNLDSKVQMEIANSVWNDEDFAVKDEFSNNLEEYFDAESTELDFADPNSKDVINNWVNDKTNGKIEEIINFIPDNAVMYLINAVYFKGSWVYAFDSKNTKEKDFNLENGNQEKVEMMSQKIPVQSYSDDDIQMVDLPYGDGFFTMTLIRPNDYQTPIDSVIQTQLSLENLENWYSNSIVDTADIYIPKFEMSYEKKLNETLSTLGMPNAFSDSANFSGISEAQKLKISSVKHKSFLKIDEEGTEAAAVTSVEISTTSIGPIEPEFRLDRSFLMVLREKESGTILFMGRINNPNE